MGNSHGFHRVPMCSQPASHLGKLFCSSWLIHFFTLWHLSFHIFTMQMKRCKPGVTGQHLLFTKEFCLLRQRNDLELHFLLLALKQLLLLLIPPPFHSWNHNANKSPHYMKTSSTHKSSKALQPGSTSTNFSSRKLSLASCAQLCSTHFESALKQSWPQSESLSHWVQSRSARNYCCSKKENSREFSRLLALSLPELISLVLAEPVANTSARAEELACSFHDNRLRQVGLGKSDSVGP